MVDGVFWGTAWTLELVEATHSNSSRHFRRRRCRCGRTGIVTSSAYVLYASLTVCVVVLVLHHVCTLAGSVCEGGREAAAKGAGQVRQHQAAGSAVGHCGWRHRVHHQTRRCRRIGRPGRQVRAAGTRVRGCVQFVFVWKWGPGEHLVECLRLESCPWHNMLAT